MQNSKIEKTNIFREDQPITNRQQTLDKGLLIADLEWTIIMPKNGEFINTPENQKLMPNVEAILKFLNRQGYSIYLTSNQGGIEEGYLSREIAIAKMRFLLNLCPYIQRIYFSVNDEEVWVVTRNFPCLDKLTLSINTPSRYVLYGGMGDDPKNFLGGFRKPNPGMLCKALYDWVNRYDLLLGAIDPDIWIKGFYDYIEPESYMKNLDPISCLIPNFVFYAGDREEDKQAAEKAKIPFIDAGEFHQGNILQLRKDKDKFNSDLTNRLKE